MSDNNNSSSPWTYSSRAGTPEKPGQSAAQQRTAALKAQGWGDFGHDDMEQHNPLAGLIASMAAQEQVAAATHPVIETPTITNQYEALNQLPVAAVPMSLNQQLNFDMSAMLAAGTLPPAQHEQRPSQTRRPQQTIAARPGAMMDFTSELMRGFATSVTEQAKSAGSAVSSEIMGQITGTDVHASLRRQQEQLAEKRRVFQALAPQIRRQHAEAQQVAIQNLSESHDYTDTMRRMQDGRVAKEMDQAKDTMRSIAGLSPLARIKAVISRKNEAAEAEKTVMKRLEAKKNPPKATAKSPSGPGSHLNTRQARDKGGKELSAAGGVQ